MKRIMTFSPVWAISSTLYQQKHGQVNFIFTVYVSSEGLLDVYKSMTPNITETHFRYLNQNI